MTRRSIPIDLYYKKNIWQNDRNTKILSASAEYAQRKVVVVARIRQRVCVRSRAFVVVRQRADCANSANWQIDLLRWLSTELIEIDACFMRRKSMSWYTFCIHRIFSTCSACSQRECMAAHKWIIRIVQAIINAIWQLLAMFGRVSYDCPATGLAWLFPFFFPHTTYAI